MGGANNDRTNNSHYNSHSSGAGNDSYLAVDKENGLDGGIMSRKRKLCIEAVEEHLRDKNVFCKTRDISKSLGFSRHTVLVNLSKLKKNGVVVLWKRRYWGINA